MQRVGTHRCCWDEYFQPRHASPGVKGVKYSTYNVPLALCVRWVMSTSTIDMLFRRVDSLFFDSGSSVQSCLSADPCKNSPVSSLCPSASYSASKPSGMEFLLVPVKGRYLLEPRRNSGCDRLAQRPKDAISSPTSSLAVVMLAASRLRMAAVPPLFSSVFQLEEKEGQNG